MLTLAVRALYTINGHPPYMLARSSSKVEVSIIPQHAISPHSPPDIVYGKVSLRSCLDAICQSRSVKSSVFRPTPSNVFLSLARSLHPQATATGLSMSLIRSSLVSSHTTRPTRPVANPTKSKETARVLPPLLLSASAGSQMLSAAQTLPLSSARSCLMASATTASKSSFLSERFGPTFYHCSSC